MIDREKVIKGLECCLVQTDEVPPLCEECPYCDEKIGTCEYYFSDLLSDAITLLKEQNRIIEKYHEADGFLFAHGWRWTDD